MCQWHQESSPEGVIGTHSANPIKVKQTLGCRHNWVPCQAPRHLTSLPRSLPLWGYIHGLPGRRGLFLCFHRIIDQRLIKLNSIDLLQCAELSWIKESHMGIVERLLTSLYSVALRAFSTIVFTTEQRDMIFGDSKAAQVSVYSGAIASKSPK